MNYQITVHLPTGPITRTVKADCFHDAIQIERQRLIDEQVAIHDCKIVARKVDEQ